MIGLDKMEKIEAPINSERGPNFHFPSPPRPGRQVALVNELTHSFIIK